MVIFHFPLDCFSKLYLCIFLSHFPGFFPSFLFLPFFSICTTSTWARNVTGLGRFFQGHDPVVIMTDVGASRWSPLWELISNGVVEQLSARCRPFVHLDEEHLSFQEDFQGCRMIWRTCESPVHISSRIFLEREKAR